LRIEIAQAGGIACIMEAMDRHKAHPGIQDQAIAALRNIAANDENRITIIKSGGVPRIIRAMATHRAHAEVQEASCRALKNLSHVELEVLQGQIIPVKGLFERVTDAMAAPNATETTKEKGRELLQLFYVSDPSLAMCLCSALPQIVNPHTLSAQLECQHRMVSMRWNVNYHRRWTTRFVFSPGLCALFVGLQLGD